jgi:hypothetical protein
MEPNVSDNSCHGLESTQGCRLHTKHPSTAAEGPNFPVASQASEQIFSDDSQDPAYRVNRQSLGFRGCKVSRGFARRAAPMVQRKSGSSDLIETGGSQSAYRRSVFWETRWC